MDVVNLPWGAPSLQTIAVQQQDGREDTAGSFLHESAQAIKYVSERIPFSHHLENPFLHGDLGFCALAVFDITSAKARRAHRSAHTGTISGRLRGNFAIVSVLTFKCWATSIGGVWVIQSDRETSMNWGALNTSRTCRSVSPVFLI
jgi:hypothetical protein